MWLEIVFMDAGASHRTEQGMKPRKKKCKGRVEFLRAVLLCCGLLCWERISDVFPVLIAEGSGFASPSSHTHAHTTLPPLRARTHNREWRPCCRLPGRRTSTRGFGFLCPWKSSMSLPRKLRQREEEEEAALEDEEAVEAQEELEGRPARAW